MALLDLFSDKQVLPAECEILIDGKAIEDLYPALVSVTVETDRARATVANLVFDSRRLEQGKWSVQDDKRIKTWKPIQIDAVFGGENEEVMRGFIREIHAQYPQERGTANVTIRCQDHSLAFDRTHVEQRWGVDAPTNDGRIASDIAKRNKVSLDGLPGTGQVVQDVLQNTTDMRFLQQRARANGYEIIFHEGKLHFGDMRLDNAPQPNIMVYAGEDTNCIQFSINDDGHRPDTVEYQIAAQTGTNAPAQTVRPNLTLLGNEPAESRGAGLSDFVWRPQREGISDDTQMRALAQQMANTQSMKISAEGELDGSRYGHVLRIGEPVGVDGAGDKYSGIYYVDTATHTFNVDGYKVSFKLLRNAYGDNLDSASNPLAGIL